MIRPRRAFIMPRITALQVRYTADRSVSIVNVPLTSVKAWFASVASVSVIAYPPTF
ncbi:hypothetical protein LDC_0215, partial [sediment metagenome]